MRYSYETLCLQARCMSLGFDPGPLDGKYGSITRDAVAKATAYQRARGKPLLHPSGVVFLRGHWTAGAYGDIDIERRAYNFLIDRQGREIAGYTAPPATTNHTRNANGRTISVSMDCMAGAQERPLWWGTAPMTEAQVEGYCRTMARLAKEYDVAIHVATVQTHAEVEPVLGIKQKQKWDVAVLPSMKSPGDPVTVGNVLRARIKNIMEKM